MSDRRRGDGDAEVIDRRLLSYWEHKLSAAGCRNEAVNQDAKRAGILRRFADMQDERANALLIGAESGRGALAERAG